MVEYISVKRTHGIRGNQTLGSPIMFLDTWELGDVLAALACILIFGVILYSWFLMILGLTWSLVVGPKIKKYHNRGILLHWPYKFLSMKLPGLINPGTNRVYSD